MDALRTPGPNRPRSLNQAADLSDTDIVVENVDAVISGDTSFDHRHHVSGFANIGPVRQGLSALALNNLNGFLGRCQVDVSTEYLRTFARERDRDDLAAAPARTDRPGADDECYFAFEPISDVRTPSGPSSSRNNTFPRQSKWRSLCTTTVQLADFK